MVDALEIKLRHAETVQEKIATLNALSLATKPKDYNLALNYAIQAEELSKQCGNKKGLADALLNKAIALAPSGQYERVHELLSEAQQLYEALGDEKGLSNALSNFGSLSVMKGDFIKALIYTQESLKLRQALGDKIGEAASLNNLGGIHYYLSNFDTALEYFLESLRLKEEIGDVHGKAYTLGNIGSVYRRTGNLELALAYHRESLLLWEQLEDKLGEARTRGEIGIILDDMAQTTQAICELERAKHIFLEHNHPHGLANTHRDLANIYRKQYQLERAFAEIRTGLNYSEIIDDKYGEMQAYFILGMLHSMMQRGD